MLGILPKNQFLVALVVALVLFGTEIEASRRRKKDRELVDLQPNKTAASDNRKGKFFSLFNIVRFSNDGCTTMSTTVTGENRRGVCYSVTECTDRGGAASGNCAAGFGVCCLFILDGSGSTTVTENCTYIQNEGFPTELVDANTQTFTVNKCSDDVCFLRLDFEQFSLVGTNGSANPDEGVCIDTFEVMTPTAMLVPVICGENSQQHIYVDIGANPGDTAMLMFTTADLPNGRLWDIKISQIECSNKNRPRDSCCLQWFTGCTGRITSFNYANANDNHLNNQQYQICVRQECGFCCVQYQVCPDQLGTLSTGANAGAGPGYFAGYSFDTVLTPLGFRSGTKADGQCVTQIGGGGAKTTSRDHIGIPASGAMCSLAGSDCARAINSRYCGGSLNQNIGGMVNIGICDCTGPFSIDVFFNNVNDMDGVVGNPNTSHSRGFCLEYMQVPC